MKQADAPVTWLISSAQNTPCTPSPRPGSSSVSGATSTTLRSVEKTSAWAGRFSETKVDCPVSYSAIKGKAPK